MNETKTNSQNLAKLKQASSLKDKSSSISKLLTHTFQPVHNQMWDKISEKAADILKNLTKIAKIIK